MKDNAIPDLVTIRLSDIPDEELRNTVAAVAQLQREAYLKRELADIKRWSENQHGNNSSAIPSTADGYVRRDEDRRDFHVKDDR